jgi:hypothetical protein
MILNKYQFLTIFSRKKKQKIKQKKNENKKEHEKQTEKNETVRKK